LLFEAIAIALVSVLGSWITGKETQTVGALAIMFSIIAMTWNLIFNWMFDLWDRCYRNSAPRGVLIRTLHACLYEAFFLVVGMFLIAWWLDISLFKAFMLDLGMAGFFLVYAFCYNWAYDLVFPVPKAIPQPAD